MRQSRSEGFSPRGFLFTRGVVSDEALQVANCDEAFYLFFEVGAFFGGVPIILMMSAVEMLVPSFGGGVISNEPGLRWYDLFF